MKKGNSTHITSDGRGKTIRISQKSARQKAIEGWIKAEERNIERLKEWRSDVHSLGSDEDKKHIADIKKRRREAVERLRAKKKALAKEKSKAAAKVKKKVATSKKIRGKGGR